MLIKKKVTLAVVFVIIGFLVFTGPRIKSWVEWDIAKTVIASAAYPCEVGLNNPMQVTCFTSGYPPICMGGALCYTKDVATCSMYSTVTGLPAGGCMTPMVLLQQTAIAMAGVMPAGGLIAGCMGPTLCDTGPLAGPGGCYNCFAKGNLKIYAKEKLDFFIAGFKGLIK